MKTFGSLKTLICLKFIEIKVCEKGEKWASRKVIKKPNI